MNWLDRRIDDFIRYVRDRNPAGVDPRNPIMIGGKRNPETGVIENPTYWRWFVWPRNRFVNCYLHNFLRDDEEDPHDHRMINISVVLSRIGYQEDLFAVPPKPGLPLPPIVRRNVRFMRPRIRLPSTPHRVVLHRQTYHSGAAGSFGEYEKPVPIWSLFIGFPHWRDWGFWCGGNGRARWVPQQVYIGVVDPNSSDYGTKGRGCDE